MTLNMMTNTRYIAYDKSGVYGPFVSFDTAETYAIDRLNDGHVRELKTPTPDQTTRPQPRAA